MAEAQLQSAVLTAVQVSLLNSSQARQISIFTCVALAVFCLAPHRPIKALFVTSTRSARNISQLVGIRKTTFRRGKYRSKIEGQCALVCGRLAEFVLAQLSGAHALGEQRRAPELLARATIQTDYGIDLGPAADNLLAVVLFVGGAPE